jgi:hypothetical protein
MLKIIAHAESNVAQPTRELDAHELTAALRH